MGMDVDQATLELVKEGTIQATISQKPFTMAFLGLKALDDLHHYPLKPLARDYGSDASSPIPASSTPEYPWSIKVMSINS